MAEIVLRRQWRLIPAFSYLREVLIPRNNQPPAAPYCTTSISAANVEEEDERKKQEQKAKEGGKWFYLPPYTGDDASSVVKRTVIGLNSGKSSSENSPMSVLKWVLRCCPHLPKSLIHKFFRLRQVRKEASIYPDSESEPVRRVRRVSAKDAILIGDRICLPVTYQNAIREVSYACSMEEINYMQSLELYKDSAIIAVNKPPGLPVQGGSGIRISLDALAATSLRYDYEESPRLVHRLDKDSSGVLVMGRTEASACLLHAIFREKTLGAHSDDAEEILKALHRRYWALVIGIPRKRKGIISAPITEVVLDNGKSRMMALANDSGKISSLHAVTKYQVLKTSDDGYALLELSPVTGRKHQLRVHCAEVLGTPIVGDYKYGWQAHKKWKPIPCCSEDERNQRKPRNQSLPFGLDNNKGSMSEEHPALHLHCRQMILPNVSVALRQCKQVDLRDVEKLDIVAPLPTHMQRSLSEAHLS